MFVQIKIGLIIIPFLRIALSIPLNNNLPSDDQGIDPLHDSLNFPAENKYCLSCHQGIEPIREHTSKMMQAEAGKIQGAVWGWGALEGYSVKWGNYEISWAAMTRIVFPILLIIILVLAFLIIKQRRKLKTKLS